MRVPDLVKKHETSISFEFFPPKTPKGVEELFAAIKRLEACDPTFVSVTYGAAGTTREMTHRIVERIMRETSIPTVPHLTCVCHKRKEIRAILKQYDRLGVENILALRGDPPSGMEENYNHLQDEFPYAADLMREIMDFNKTAGKGFAIGVAGFPEGHPETQNRLKEMDYFKRKVDAGAGYITTQLFFDNNDFYDFRERCHLAGIDIPIIAGIMPILTHSGMCRMAELAAGARFPAKLQKALISAGDDKAAMARAGTEYATEQSKDLIANKVEGLHFFTLNKSCATIEIAKELGVHPFH